METIEYAGHKFQYEKLMPEHFKMGCCPFRLVDENGDEQYIVVTTQTMAEQVEGKTEIKTPKDGVPCAFCPNRASALMVASSIGIAATMAMASAAKEKTEHDVRKLADEMGVDLDALAGEVKKLRLEGKSADEIRDALMPRIGEFKKKADSPDKDKGGEW